MKLKTRLPRSIALALALAALATHAPAVRADDPVIIDSNYKAAVPFHMSGFTGVAESALKFDFEVAGFKFVPADQAKFTLSGKNNGSLEGRLFDSAGGALVQKAYGSPNMRANAHALADDVIFAIRHEKGVFQTKIAFRVESQGESEVAIADYDGHNVEFVTRDRSIVQGPSWVPGAFQLVYTSYKSGFPGIYFQDLSNGARRVLAQYPGANFSPAVSPDGRHMAMILSKTGNVDLFVSNIDGSGLRQLTHSKEDESSPCWSPDSSTICFVGRYGGRAALWTIPAGGGQPVRLLTAGVLNTTEPDWSPDGKTIAFTCYMGEFNICTVPAAGGEAKILVSGQDPSWAQNSRTVIFTRQEGYRRHLSLLDVPTKTVKDMEAVSGSCSQPSWAR